MRSTHKSTSIWEIELRLLQMLALEMVLKTFHFVPGLSRTPLLFSSISHQHISRKYLKKTKTEMRPLFFVFHVFLILLGPSKLLKNDCQCTDTTFCATVISQAKWWPHCCLPISPRGQIGKRQAFVMKTLLPTSATICQCSERLRAGELNARVGTQCIAQIWACVFSLLAIVSSFLWMSKYTFRCTVIPLSLRTPSHPVQRCAHFSHIFILTKGLLDLS